MGTRRGRVSITVASNPLAPDTEVSGARRARPCARDPPSLAHRKLTALRAGPRACDGGADGKSLPAPQRPKRGERRCAKHRLSHSRTREASPSYS